MPANGCRTSPPRAPSRDNFDIWATAGAVNRAWVMELDDIAVSDGTLNLTFKANVDYPSIAGIEVFCRTGC